MTELSIRLHAIRRAFGVLYPRSQDKMRKLSDVASLLETIANDIKTLPSDSELDGAELAAAMTLRTEAYGVGAE